MVLHPSLVRSARRTAAVGYRRIAGKKRYQGLFERLLDLSLAGMNFVGSDLTISGELVALHRVATSVASDSVVVFDVGANVGDYARAVIGAFGSRATVYAFEPSAETFDRLASATKTTPNIVPIRSALSDSAGTAALYSDAPASGLASLMDRDLAHVGIKLSEVEEVEASTVDIFCAEREIERITLLKIDVEGLELAVLRGARSMIESGRIDFIQFEFGGTNIDSRVFLRDFFRLLHPSFAIFRILQDGLRELREYDERHEVFRTVNYLAARRVEISR